MGRPPGLLRAGANPDVVMMLCTAGHVDHGKTALVRLLTGCNTDRLKEEQERGLTIELGFAPCVLGGEIAAGIVDVPGHEKFVRTMVAGVSGIDMAILVIAADDGIMPQTVEHFQIMDLMGVRNGIVALTKIDLVAPERVAQVTQEIQAFLEGTFMTGAPVCPVSSQTGEGIFEFYEILVTRIREIAKRSKRGVFRMPVERSFVQKGFGTIVTGIPVDGTVKLGDELELLPGGGIGHVRGVQRFLRNATEGGYGQCLALNLPEFSKLPPQRGQVLCRPGYLKPATHFYAALRAVGGIEKPLANAEPVKFHTGTAEQNGKVYFLQGIKALRAGDRAYALVVVTKPVAAVAHDRFILRRPSPAATVAGGQILMASMSPLRGKKDALAQQLEEYDSLWRGLDPASPEASAAELAYCLRVRAPAGATAKELAATAFLPEAAVAEWLADPPPEGIVHLSAGWFIHKDAYEARLAELEERLDKAAMTRSLSITLAELRTDFQQWPQPLWIALQEDLEKKGRITARGSKVVLQDAVRKLPHADQRLLEQIRDLFEQTRFNSPRPDELPDRLGVPQTKIDPLLKLLCDDGRLVRLAPKVILSYNAAREAQQIFLDIIKKSGVVDSADFKYAINSSRKFALAILDYLDARRITVRTGNLRRLAPDYEKGLLK